MEAENKSETVFFYHKGGNPVNRFLRIDEKKCSLVKKRF